LKFFDIDYLELDTIGRKSLSGLDEIVPLSCIEESFQGVALKDLELQ